MFLCYCGVASVALMSFSFCVSNWQVLALAVVVASASAGNPPTFMRQLGMYFPGHKRGTAMGIFQMRIFIGTAFASMCILLAYHYGWRAGFFFVGACGLVSCLVGSVVLRNDIPKYEHFLEQEEESFLSKVMFLLRNPTMLLMVVGTFFRYAAGLGQAFYEPLYFSEQFPEYMQEYSVVNSVAILITPFFLYAAGKIADIKESQSKFKWAPLICGLTNLVSIPLIVVVYTTNSFLVASVCLLIMFPVSETYISLNLSILLNVTPKSMHALRKL